MKQQVITATTRNRVRFGFLSTAQIGRKNWKAIRHSGNAVLTAVASRDIHRSRAFIEGCQREAPFDAPPAPLAGYEELIRAKDVDALYIPLPTALRKEWVIRAAEAGKHIVCEKPCALATADLRQMIDACRRNRVQFIDGVMFVHHPRMEHLRRALDDPAAVGKVKRMMSVFSFAGDASFLRENIRVKEQLEPAGCLGDLGWYCIRFMLWTMRWQMPREVTGRILPDTTINGRPGLPLEFSAELIFEGGTSGAFYCSFLVEHQQWVTVSGSRGSLRVPDFVHTSNDLECAFELNRKEVRVSSALNGETEGEEVAQQTLLFRNFSSRVLGGDLDETWPEMALKTQRVMDACLESARAGSRSVQIR